MNFKRMLRVVTAGFMAGCFAFSSFGTALGAETGSGAAPEAAAVSASVYGYSAEGTGEMMPDTAAGKKNGPGLDIVRNGRADAVIVIAADAGEQTRKAAETLVRYVKQSTGAELPVLTQAELAPGNVSGGKTRIYVGTIASHGEPHVDGLLAGLPADGFVIHPHGNALTIIGPAEIGTEYGVYEFLERYVGVRWLLPGPDGEDVPQQFDLSVPRADVSQQPAMRSRMMWPLQYVNQVGSSPMLHEWGVRNRLRIDNAGFEHNVWRFFPPSQYKTTHPEFYPLRNGVRYFPPNNSTASGWQPCFSEEGTVQAAVTWILDYFRRNPDVPSVSLGVNDSGGYCETEPGHPLQPTLAANSLGLPNMSDIYYRWVNKVVAQVLDVYPDKWFGLLAYQEVYDPPTFPLNDRVIPYLTKERLSWIDPDVRENDQQVVDRWKQKAEYLGFYDYVYGSPYSLPRIYNRQFADTYRYAQDNQVIAYYGELFPYWGEGPKNWIMTKLLWDPQQDVDALLDDWYKRAVGAEAAPYLKAYFDHWEDFWTNRIRDTDWFQGGKNNAYHLFSSSAYLSAVTDEEMAQSREWLETALAKSVTPQQKARAALLLRAFEYYEASALSYPKEYNAIADADTARKVLEDAVNIETKLDFAQKRLDLIGEFASDPLLRFIMDPRPLGMVWSGWNPSAFWKLADYLKQYDAVNGGQLRSQITDLSRNGETELIRNYAKLLLSAADGQPLNANPSFEEAAETDNGKVTAAHWDANIVKYGKFERKEEHPYTGNASIYVHNFYFGDINQTVPVEPGLIITKLRYFVTEDTKTVGDIWLELNLLDANGTKMKTIKSARQPFSTSLGKWADIQIMDNVPAEVNGVPVKQVKMSATVNGFFEGGTMYLDDFSLYQASRGTETP